MAKAKKSAGKGGSGIKLKITDVAHPGTTAPSDTSKPIITSRPMIKDPMVVEADEDEKPVEEVKTLARKSSEAKIIPAQAEEATTEKTEDSKSADTESDEDDQTRIAADKPDQTDETPAGSESAAGDEKTMEEGDKGVQPSKDNGGDKDRKAADQDVKLQQLVDSKKYFLPINAVEHRRSKHVVIAGIVLSVLLAVAWADIALDAGIIHGGGIKPVTHFFSN